MRWIVVTALGAGGGGIAASAQAAKAPPEKEEPVSLLGILSEWQYPGSKMLHGATMQDGGNPAFPSTFCHAVLTTPDPLDKVVAFYAKAPAGDLGMGRPAPKKSMRDRGSECVLVQDDSNGRPAAVRVIVVNRANATTTLVVSRAANETATHVAWSHHLRHTPNP